MDYSRTLLDLIRVWQYLSTVLSLWDWWMARWMSAVAGAQRTWWSVHGGNLHGDFQNPDQTSVPLTGDYTNTHRDGDEEWIRTSRLRSHGIRISLLPAGNPSPCTARPDRLRPVGGGCRSRDYDEQRVYNLDRRQGCRCCWRCLGCRWYYSNSSRVTHSVACRRHARACAGIWTSRRRAACHQSLAATAECPWCLHLAVVVVVKQRHLASKLDLTHATDASILHCLFSTPSSTSLIAVQQLKYPYVHARLRTQAYVSCL